MFHLFSSYFLYPTIFFSSPSSSFSLLPPVWHRDKSILALTPNVRKSGQTLCEIDVNPMTAPNMMIYHITNAYVGACAVGLARSSCQLYLPHPFHDKEKGSYLIDCTFNGMHVHRGNTTLVWEYPQQLQTKSESIIWRKIPQISVGLAVLQESKKIIIDTFVPAPPDTPDNICNLWLFFFFAVYQIQIGKGHLECSYCGSISNPRFLVEVLKWWLAAGLKMWARFGALV